MKTSLLTYFFAVGVLVSCNSTSQRAEEGQLVNKDSLEFILNIPQKVKPEYVSAFKKNFEECQAETLKEDGCLEYVLFQSDSDSTKFHIFERWSNISKQVEHTKTAHFKKLIESNQGIFDGDKEFIESYIITD